MNIYLFLDERNELLNEKLINFCTGKFNILDIFNNENKYTNNKFNKNIDFSISFLYSYIIKDINIINNNCINFHPSTPKYRGVCGASLALYNNDKYYGSTAHYINSNIDDGGIIDISEFLIKTNINCIELNNESRNECLKLAIKILDNIYNFKKLPKININLKWGNILMTRKKFKEWLHIKIDNKELENKIKAAENNLYPGPFIKIKNNIYALKKIN